MEYPLYRQDRGQMIRRPLYCFANEDGVRVSSGVWSGDAGTGAAACVPACIRAINSRDGKRSVIVS